MSALRESYSTVPAPLQPSAACSRLPSKDLVRRPPSDNYDACVNPTARRKESRHRERSALKNRRSLNSRLIRSFTLNSWFAVVLLAWTMSLSVATARSVELVYGEAGRELPDEMDVGLLLHARSASATNTHDLPPSITSRTTATTSAASTGIISDAGDDDSSLPSPFDSVSLTTNFTASSCPVFFRTFLADPDFHACLPLSLLLQTSNAFFSVTEKGTVATTKVIDATCNVQNVTFCDGIMEKYGWMIGQQSHCGADMEAGNPIVQQAYDGFIAYSILYTAGCQKSDSGSYCYVDAITNTESPSDSYIYYLPLGLSLPGGSRPSCNTCLKTTMAAFDTVAGNATQPLSGTYVPAAEQINLGCGPTYVNATVQTLSSRAPSSTSGFSLVAAGLAAALALVGNHLLL